MHSVIFQISTKPIEVHHIFTSEEIFDMVAVSPDCYAEYVDTLSEFKRAEAITELAFRILPSELFDTNADGSFTYKGGLKEWIEENVFPEIRKAAEALSFESIKGCGIGSMNYLIASYRSPLLRPVLFVSETSCLVMKSGKFLYDFVSDLKPGDKIYIGGVYQYSF